MSRRVERAGIGVRVPLAFDPSLTADDARMSAWIGSGASSLAGEPGAPAERPDDDAPSGVRAPRRPRSLDG